MKRNVWLTKNENIQTTRLKAQNNETHITAACAGTVLRGSKHETHIKQMDIYEREGGKEEN